ncbi:MAG: ABC transporter substrate-binding protein [Actinomycetota bacterium]|nr:ABC transporter substrate-binding protein [Actinomycetota bacterium]
MREPTMREERRPVTALFADLVGSTALAEQLDDAEVKLVVGEAIARVVTEVERLGGYVKDLAGDGVLAFFGAPVASEDDAERALLAGLAILESIAAYASDVERGWGISGFGVRIGVTTGPVVVGAVGAGTRVEYAAFGDTINTAARLQSAAEPGSILVDDTTRRLTEPLFEWGESTRHTMKGKEQPVTAHRPLRARTEAAKLRGLEGVETLLVGRQPELARVRAALESVSSGQGGVLVVTGEAGIGKSRLLAEGRQAFGGLWLEGRCVSYGESLPYWPFRDLVREWLGAALDDPELRVRVTLRRAIADLFGDRELEIYPYLCALLGIAAEPEAAARLTDLSPEALQYRTFEVVEALLERLAANAPLAVLLDDLHWADATSVQLVERLLPIGERAAVLLVVMQRDERDHPSWAVRERAARDVPHLLTEVALEPLEGESQRALLESMVGKQTLPDDLQMRILAAADGNPFYLEELLRSLIDEGAIARQNGGWRFDHDASVDVPPTVERVILARVDRLTPACHDVLTAASALGRRFGLPLLHAVLGSDGIDDSLHELQRLDLLRATRRWPQPEYRFKHALIQEAAYGTLLPDTRKALHRAAAEWLESQYEDAEGEVLGLLAHHWLAAEDESKAVAYLTRAGDEARLAWSLDEAIEHYRRLLPLLERRGQTQEMALTLFKLALALHTALRFRESNQAYQQAFELWESPESTVATAVFRLGFPLLPSQPDPPRSYMPRDIMLQMALFDRLVERWPEATIVPSLAERWEIADDGLRYRFTLREGLMWSDGVPLTAADVTYGVERNLDRARPGVSVAMLFALENAQDYFRGRNDDLEAVGVEALDDRTVEFRLVAPAPYFFSMVNRPDAGPQPRHAVEEHGDDWIAPASFVGNGAFELIELDPERVVLERRASRGRRGNVRRVEYVRDDSADLRERYAAGELEMAPLGVGSGLDDDVFFSPTAYLTWLVLDHEHPDLARLEVRQALAHAIDRVELEALLPVGWVVATGGIVPPMLQGHTPGIVPRHEPELAQRLLESSPLTTPLTLEDPSGLVYEESVRAIAAMWERTLGIEVGYDSREESDIGIGAWAPGYPDPEYYLRLLLHSEAQDNYGHFRHEPFDELIELARAEPDGRKRLELFHAADRMAVAEQAAVIPVAYSSAALLVKPHVHGWWEYGKSWSSFADLAVDEPG